MRPYLYHLTDKNNLPQIIAMGRILSTKGIVKLSDMQSPKTFLQGRRDHHTLIRANGIDYKIRDQRPISIKVLKRSLTNNWTSERFIEHLNSKVFFWPTIERLSKHYTRYSFEKPVILRFKSSDILNLNLNAEFSRLNSGATRCSSHWNGNAPERGPLTFVTAPNFNYSFNAVAEVTIPEYCNLPQIYWQSAQPTGPWRRLK